MIHIRPVLHQHIQKGQKCQAYNQHKARRCPVKGPEHPHQDLLPPDVFLCNWPVQGIGNGRSHAQLRKR